MMSTSENPPLYGVRVWLSGSVPPGASDAQKGAIRSFVEGFAAAVFRGGGHILHGSHPSFTEPLIKAAQAHIGQGGRHDCLMLAVSRHWSKDATKVPLEAWRATCTVYETPEAATGDRQRDESLQILRRWMAERCDAFVAVGGEWWKHVDGRAGVPLEAGLAIDRGLPCFLLGGLGGVAADYIKSHPEVIRALKNGLDFETNGSLATREDVNGLVGYICEQLGRLPLVHGRVSDGLSFRILALDGGGIKGAFTAAVLATLEEALGVPVADHFDLIAGTSTGGILAIGLGLGLTTKRMLEFYRERGTTVFPLTHLPATAFGKLHHWIAPKHSQAVLLKELTRAYFERGPAKVMSDSRHRLVIPAYDAVGGVCHIFRTPHNDLLKGDASTNAAQVAVATAAAPTYYASASVQNLVSSSLYIDGGVWANCPALAAIVEAVCYLNVPLDRVDVLSIGTTEEPFTVRHMAKAGIARWAPVLHKLLLNAQMDTSVRHAQELVGEPRFLRVNTMTAPGRFELDSAREIEDLIALGNSEARKPDLLSQVKSRFLNGVSAMAWK